MKPMLTQDSFQDLLFKSASVTSSYLSSICDSYESGLDRRRLEKLIVIYGASISYTSDIISHLCQKVILSEEKDLYADIGHYVDLYCAMMRGLRKKVAYLGLHFKYNTISKATCSIIESLHFLICSSDMFNDAVFEFVKSFVECVDSNFNVLNIEDSQSWLDGLSEYVKQES